MIKILIADDHPLVRRGIKQLISETRDMEVTGVASTGPEVIEKASKNDYDVVLLDITMPGISGLEILKQLKHDHPRLPVLILSFHPEEQYAVRALRAGAAGYLTKESAPDELIVALRAIARGKKYVTSSLADKLVEAVGIEIDKLPHERLSDREFQVLRLIASGKGITEIAGELFLSPKTVSTYRSRILLKTGMKNSAELTHYAIAHGLVE